MQNVIEETNDSNPVAHWLTSMVGWIWSEPYLTRHISMQTPMQAVKRWNRKFNNIV